MNASAVSRIVSGMPGMSAVSSASGMAALFVGERTRDMPGLVIPRPEVHLVARFGPPVPGGLDVHAMGVRERVIRKSLPRGQRVVMARLQLGAAEAVLGLPGADIAGRAIPLDQIWGDAATRRLCERLAAARGSFEAAAMLDNAIAERFARAGAQRTSTQLALAAVGRLSTSHVSAVAGQLGVSERHLRRVFREAIGVSPKTFAKLTRFRRAVRAAGTQHHDSWSTIAACVGYYDQAHLIAEFRAISGVTPSALLSELRAAHAIG